MSHGGAGPGEVSGLRRVGWRWARQGWHRAVARQGGDELGSAGPRVASRRGWGWWGRPLGCLAPRRGQCSCGRGSQRGMAAVDRDWVGPGRASACDEAGLLLAATEGGPGVASGYRPTSANMVGWQATVGSQRRLGMWVHVSNTWPIQLRSCVHAL